MAKFSEGEKERIRECLLAKGKELFLQYGLAKTSIDDIVQACGIAKGSFYKFYSSKEELFYVILQKQEEIPRQLMEELLQKDLPPKEMLASFFHTAFKLADENVLLRQWFKDGEYERVIRKLPRELLEETSQGHINKGISFVETLIQRGILRDEDPEVVTGVMKAIMLLRLHKEQLGDEIFPRIMDIIIECVAEGLSKK